VNPKHLALRDRWLEEFVLGMLGHDDRLRGIDAAGDLSIRFDGGVAHAQGQVANQADRERLREGVCSLRGVYAFWDGIVVGECGPLRILDVGSGGAKQKAAAAGVDLFRSPGVDVVADVRRRLPFADRTVDRIYAVHVLEHVLDMVGVMNELHRVLADDGVLHVLSPHWQAIGAVADPTHVKYLDVQTFKWFCGPHASSALWYPLHTGYDGASVFADLAPVRSGQPLPPPERLARFFD
jgi:SAM-dependent methyltransferase